MKRRRDMEYVSLVEDQTADTLRYWDRIRARPLGSNETAELHEESHVIRLSLPQQEDNGNDDVRLCHLTSMLPSTNDDQGTLQPDYGLYTEGAGLLALLHFNNRDTSIVQDLGRLRGCNVQLTMDFGDTQFSPMQACRVLAQDVVPIDRPHTLEQPHPVSIVGATRSAVTGPLAILASVYELPVVSYGSTSSQLNSRATYPYFGRTVPTNQGDAIAAAQYFRQVLGVTHMGVLFVKDGFGSAFHKEFVTAAKQTLDDPPMTLLSIPYDPDGGEEGARIALQQLRDSGYDFFYGIISTPTYNTVMRQAHALGIAGHPGKTWILSGDSGQILGADYSYDAATDGDLAAATSGVGVISLNIEHNPAFDEAWSMLEGNKAIKDYFVAKHSPELDFSEFQFYDAPTYWDYLAYDVVMALGFAACEAKEDFFTGPQLFDSMMSTLFRGASGQVEFDANTGTRKTSSLSYKITNVVAKAPDADGKIFFETADTRMQDPSLNNTWVLIPDAPAYVYADGTTTAPPGLPPLEENQHLIGPGIMATGLVFGILTILLSLFSAGWVRWYKDSQVVRMAQPFFLLVVCLGTFLMSLAVVPMSFQEPMSQQVLDAACMSVPWLFSSGFVVSFSALLSKTLRIYRLMQGGKSFRRVVVTVGDVMRPFLGLATLNVGLLAAWSIASPLRWKRLELHNYDEYGRSTDSYGTCRSNNPTLQGAFAWSIVAVDLIALIAANVVNYKARRISARLHDASTIALSMAIMLEAALIGTPAMLVVEQYPSAFFLIRSVLVTIICGAILLPMFIPKWQLTLFKKKEDETRPSRGGRADNMMTTILTASQQRRGTVAAIRLQAKNSEVSMKFSGLSTHSRTHGLGSSIESLQYSASGHGSGIAAWHNSARSADSSGIRTMGESVNSRLGKSAGVLPPISDKESVYTEKSRSTHTLKSFRTSKSAGTRNSYAEDDLNPTEEMSISLALSEVHSDREFAALVAAVADEEQDVESSGGDSIFIDEPVDDGGTARASTKATAARVNYEDIDSDGSGSIFVGEPDESTSNHQELFVDEDESTPEEPDESTINRQKLFVDEDESSPEESSTGEDDYLYFV